MGTASAPTCRRLGRSRPKKYYLGLFIYEVTVIIG